MNKDYIDLDDAAEVIANVISQERVLAVPPAIIPDEGLSSPRKRPRKEPRNKYYQKRNPKDAQSVSAGGSPPDESPAFPIENNEVECEEILTFDDIANTIAMFGDEEWTI